MCPDLLNRERGFLSPLGQEQGKVSSMGMKERQWQLRNNEVFYASRNKEGLP